MDISNIVSIIDETLKKSKYAYNVTHYEECSVYGVFIGSHTAGIMVDIGDEYVNVQFYTEVDETGHSIYESDWESNQHTLEDIEGEIEDLIENTKEITKALSKIENLIEKAKDIAEEYHIDFSRLIDKYS